MLGQNLSSDSCQVIRDKEKFDFRFLSLDIALAHTGFAAYDLSSRNFEFKLLKIGRIDTEKGLPTDSRVRILLKEIEILQTIWNFNGFYLEEPQTLFGKAGFGAASNVIKLTASCYSLVGYLHAKDFYCRLVPHATWEYHRARSSGLKGKQWTLREAQRVLQYIHYPYRSLKGEDEHLADAVNMGIYIIQQLKAKAWMFPNSST